MTIQNSNSVSVCTNSNRERSEVLFAVSRYFTQNLFGLLFQFVLFAINEWDDIVENILLPSKAQNEEIIVILEGMKIPMEGTPG